MYNVFVYNAIAVEKKRNNVEKLRELFIAYILW